MTTRIEKLGPGSWVLFVNGQRHHETFLTRAAARREAKRQKETRQPSSFSQITPSKVL
jgi:hypothetical protein